MTLNSISQPISDKSEMSLISLGVSIRVAPNPMKTILDFKSAESPLALLDESLDLSAEDSFSHASAIGSLKRFKPYLSFICSSSPIIRWRSLSLLTNATELEALSTALTASPMSSIPTP